MQQVEEVTGAASATAAIASKATYGGSVAAMTGVAISTDWLSIGGFIVALLGFAVNLWFKMRHDRRENREQQRMEEEHAALMKRMESQP